MKTYQRMFWAGALVLGIAGSAQAALHGRLPATPGGTDFQAYWDDVLDITWTADANLAASNTFGVAYNTDLGMHSGDSYPGTYVNEIDTTGVMNWGAALWWIDAMNGANYLGVNDWRLPTALNQDGSGPCSGMDCTDSEMGHMYYVTLGNSASGPLVNTGPFTNLQPGNYWSGTERELDPVTAWDFHFFDAAYYGDQDWSSKYFSHYAWAVHPGDITVPEPASFGLVGAAIVGLGWMRRRKLVS